MGLADSNPSSRRYRTIVVDPPWDYPEGFALGPGHGELEIRPLPYPSLSIEEIAALPVAGFADRSCRLFLWTTNRYLRDAFDVMEAWGFRYTQTLVWHKTDANLVGSVAPNSAEFLLVGRRGFPARGVSLPSAVFSVPRRGPHSTKPECFLDYIESVSQPPYLEMFSRRARFGWETWGDEALHGTEAMLA
jgi:N6-adenosine-specific RNA methylase IME4